MSWGIQMTAEQLKETVARVLELAESASDGPWEVDKSKPHSAQCGIIQAESVKCSDHVILPGSSYLEADDADLIAHYRTAAPALAREIERLTAALHELETCRDHWKISFQHERENIIRLRGEIYNLHNSPNAHCACSDCLLVRQSVTQLNALNLPPAQAIPLVCPHGFPQAFDESANDGTGAPCHECLAALKQPLPQPPTL